MSIPDFPPDAMIMAASQRMKDAMPKGTHAAAVVILTIFSDEDGQYRGNATELISAVDPSRREEVMQLASHIVANADITKDSISGHTQ